jgi:hypothetical protein
MTPAHWWVDMAPVPESVSRSMSTSSAFRRNGLYSASAIFLWRSSRVVMRMGSTTLILKGSMMVFIGLASGLMVAQVSGLRAFLVRVLASPPPEACRLEGQALVTPRLVPPCKFV